jgi:hypothetical protein
MVAAMVTSCLDNRYQVGLSSMCGLLGLSLEACASPGAASDKPGVQDGITTKDTDTQHWTVERHDPFTPKIISSGVVCKLKAILNTHV